MQREIWVKRNILPLFGQGRDLEVRVRTRFFENVGIDDILTINNRLRRRIKAIRRYRNFVELLQSEEPKRILPGSTKLEILVLLREIYPSELERKGVMVFELVPDTA